MSTPVRLFDSQNRPMSVQNGVSVVTDTSAILWAGADENQVARVGLVESKFNSEVSIDAPTYGARFSPYNSTFSPPSSLFANGAPMYTRNMWGHIATAATTTVKIVEANSVSGMFFSAAASTSTFVVVSSSASDAAAGTGIRTIGIVYIGRDGLRYQTTATMNGTTNVTVNLAVAATGLEYAYGTSAGGSGGPAAGNITIKNTGSVTTMGQIATGNTNIVTTEQQVQTGRTIYLCGIRASAQTTAARIGVVYFSYDYTTGSATGAQQVDGERYRVAVGSVVYIPFNPPVSFKVPAGYTGRLWLTVTPDAVTASNYWASMDTFEATST